MVVCEKSSEKMVAWKLREYLRLSYLFSSYKRKDINGLHIIYSCLDSNANKPFYKPKGFEIIWFIYTDKKDQNL